MSKFPERFDGYLAAHVACGQYKVSFATLWRWTDKGCPYLNGKRLPTKRIPGAQRNKYRTYFHEATLDHINLARTGVDSKAYLLPAEIEKEYRFARWNLARWKNDCRYLGRPIRSRIETLVGPSGYTRRHRTYERSDLEAVAKAIEAIQPRDDYLFYQQLRRKFGTRCPSQRMLRHYATKKCRYLDGRKLATTIERQRFRDRDMEVPHYLANEVSQIIDAIPKQDNPESPYRDVEGTWLPAKAIKDVRPNRLHALTEQGRMRAKQIERFCGGRTNGKLWVYHEADVDSERRRKAGMVAPRQPENRKPGRSTLGEAVKKYGIPKNTLASYRSHKNGGGDHALGYLGRTIDVEEETFEQIIGFLRKGTPVTVKRTVTCETYLDADIECILRLKANGYKPVIRQNGRRVRNTPPPWPGDPKAPKQNGEDAPSTTPAETTTKSRGRGGRRKSKKTAEVYKACWEHYVEELETDVATMVFVNNQFGKNAVTERKHVYLFASRHAKAEDRPMRPKKA